MYGSNGSALLNRSRSVIYDRNGEVMHDLDSDSTDEAGTALGGGGSMSTRHVENFFEAVRGKEKLNAPIDDIAISHAMVHYPNVAYRINKPFEVADSGIMLSREAMNPGMRTPNWMSATTMSGRANARKSM